MKKNCIFLIGAIFSFVWVQTGFSQGNEDKIKNIQKFYAKVQQEVQHRRYQKLFFKNMNPYGGKSWEKGKPTDEDKGGEWVEVYRHKKEIPLIKLFTATPSGDWACQSDYLFPAR